MAKPDHPSTRRRSPMVSGRWTVVWLLVSFAITATIIPLVMKKPLWLEMEYVVIAWWAIWALLLTKLLYTGEQVSDDHKSEEAKEGSGPDIGSGCSNLNFCSGRGVDAEGWAIILGILALLVLIWVLIEFVIPLLFALAYFLIRGMLVHVVAERDFCKGRLGMSFLHGGFRATVYSAPLALVVYVVHYVQMRA